MPSELHGGAVWVLLNHASWQGACTVLVGCGRLQNLEKTGANGEKHDG